MLRKTERRKSHPERGVALLFALFHLLFALRDCRFAHVRCDNAERLDELNLPFGAVSTIRRQSGYGRGSRPHARPPCPLQSARTPLPRRRRKRCSVW